MQFRLMTYNMHKGIGGVDRRYRLARVAETIAHCQPDIVLLQEVDRGVPRSRHDRQDEQLRELLVYPYSAYQMNVHLTEGGYGNAILSRLPIQSTWDVDLKIPLKKRRRALAAMIHTSARSDARSVLVCNLHLGLAAFERRMQLRRLLGDKSLRDAGEPMALVIGGDFNDAFANLGRQILEPARFRCAAGKFNTFPAVMPFRPLDRIYFRGNLRCEHAFVCHTRTARQASDHLPLVVDLVAH